MKIDKNKQRKVLMSVKVSTLFLILISIIIVATISVTICNYITKKEIKADNLSKKNVEIEKLDNTNSKIQNPTIQLSERSVIPSSRSSSRREDVTISKIEEQEDIIEEQQEKLVVVTTPIEEVTISVDMDLTVRTGLSKEDFSKLISSVEEDTSGFFKENASYIYDVCEKYSINEIFFCGLISAESGWNIAQNHRNTHNYISLMSANGLIKFTSVEEGIEKAAQILHDRYLTPGSSFYYGSTLAGVKTRFCPASPTWVNLVYGRMQQILK